MKSTIAKKTQGYGYKYTELADINKYCEEHNINYYQEVETNETNGKDYIVTYLINLEKPEEKRKVRGCQIVDAVLQGIKNPAQEYGSALTYCRRYSLLMALGLATEDDDASRFTQKEDDDPKKHINYVMAVSKLIEEEKLDYDKVCELYKVEDIQKMSNKQLQHFIKNIEQVKEKLI